MTDEEALDLGERAIVHASHRDAASGGFCNRKSHLCQIILLLCQTCWHDLFLWYLYMCCYSKITKAEYMQFWNKLSYVTYSPVVDHECRLYVLMFYINVKYPFLLPPVVTDITSNLKKIATGMSTRTFKLQKKFFFFFF